MTPARPDRFSQLQSVSNALPRDGVVVGTGGSRHPFVPAPIRPAARRNLEGRHIVTEALSSTHRPVERVKAPPKVETLRCSFCRAEFADTPERTVPSKDGRGTTTGSFCSARCRYCVLALAALHPSPLALEEFASRRGVLTDRLLDLWRQGLGPDPELVLRAAERASCGLPGLDSTTPSTKPSDLAVPPPVLP
jgi:hypothetical protein